MFQIEISTQRYANIVLATYVRKNTTFSNSFDSILVIVFIWLMAFLLSSPLFFFNQLETISINFDMTHMSHELASNQSEHGFLSTTTTRTNVEAILDRNRLEKKENKIEHSLERLNIYHCIENEPFQESTRQSVNESYHTRLLYSYSSLIVQYVLPILIVGIAYGSISWKLKKQKDKLKKHQLVHLKPANINVASSAVKNDIATHDLNSANSNCEKATKSNTQKSQEKKRRLKMNILLSSIAILFAVSWLPLNIFNIMSDSKTSPIKPGHTFYIINAVCILFAMSSAVSNPFLYGFLNENFKREYKKLFKRCFNRFAICFNKKSPIETTEFTASHSNIHPNNNSNNNHNTNNNRLLKANDKYLTSNSRFESNEAEMFISRNKPNDL